MRRSLNAPQRPSQPSQRDDLLFLFFAQDIAHVTERNSPPVQCPDSAISLAGFEVSTYGRFWVSPEVEDCCNVNPEAFTFSADLYGAYCDWCNSFREKPISEKSFAGALERQGYSKGRKSGGARGRNGLELRLVVQQPIQQDTAYSA
jgi:hypothetical protein